MRISFGLMTDAVKIQTGRRHLTGIIDVGANLTHPCFSGHEVDSVIDRAKESGITKILVTGTDVLNSKDALRLAKLYPGFLYSTAGVHPHDAKDFTETDLCTIESLVTENNECVAVGECGLDFNRNFSPQDVQLEVFEKQVQLACRLQKPLFVHEREASEAMVALLSKYKSQLPPTVIHCFTGTISEAITYFNMGLYIGLTGFLWKDKLENGVQEGLKTRQFPLERIVVETDSPFMYPNVKNKKLPKEIREKISEHSLGYLSKYCNFHRNEPCSLSATVDLIAAFMNVHPSEVALNTTINATKIFGLD